MSGSLIAGVGLVCSLLQTDATLALDWRVANGGDVAVGLFLRVPMPDAPASAPPDDGAYIERVDATLVVSRMVLAVPAGLAVAFRPVPGIVELEPGLALAERLFLTRPLRTHQPFAEALQRGAVGGRPLVPGPAHPVERVILRIGFFALRPGWRLLPVSSDPREGMRAWPPGPPVDAQRILSCEIPLDRPESFVDDVPGRF